ncbi:MAG TPA: hypothetical protein VF614_12065 [Chthoniobacteraceae bacterium]
MRLFPSSSRRLLSSAVLSFAVVASAFGQSLREQPTPFSVWLDFPALASTSLERAALPIWLESVQSETLPAAEGAGEKTIFRLRLRRVGSLSNEIQLRLFFEDDPQASPIVTGWTETGARQYQSPPLGSGLSLPTSEALILPAAGLDYVDIEVPGNGRTVRGAFLTTLRKSEVRHSLDFDPSTPVTDAFNNAPTMSPSPDDAYLYGRVKATLEAGVIKLSPPEQSQEDLAFEIEAQPLIAVISFEVLNADPAYPIQTSINGQAFNPVNAVFPDLADPGYSGTVRPLQRDMRFRYTGWVRAQQIVSNSALQAGLNNLTFRLNKHSEPVAIRSVEIQLKYNWTGLGYELAP